MLAWLVTTLLATSAFAAPTTPFPADARPASLPGSAACHPSANPDEVVVCGRADSGEDQRLRPLDPRFDREARADGLLVRSLPGLGTVQGGGPKGSVGITLKLPF